MFIVIDNAMIIKITVAQLVAANSFFISKLSLYNDIRKNTEI